MSGKRARARAPDLHFWRRRWFRAVVLGLAVCVLLLVLSAPLWAQDPSEAPRPPGVAERIGKWFTAEDEKGEKRVTNPLWIFLVVTAIVTALTTIVQALRRDRLLRRHSRRYVVLLHDNARYTGILKLILQDVEIASEKTDVRGKESGRLFTREEFQKMTALLRYHDELTEKEIAERRVFVENLFNPTFVGRLGRRLQSLGRQFNATVKTIYERAIGERLRKRLQTFGRAGEQIGELAETQIEQATGVAVTREAAAYRLLIDRLIGTRVIARVGGRDVECVLADYTPEYYHLMDVEFRESWTIDAHGEGGRWAGNDKGFRVVREGRTYTIESRVPYPVTLRHARYREGQKVHGVPAADQDKNDVNKAIGPYGRLVWPAEMHHTAEERNVAGGLLQEVRFSVPIRPEHYKKVELVFETARRADVLIRYADNVIQYRAEKIEPRLVSLETISEVLWQAPLQLVLTDKDGKRIEGLHLNRGYITNLSKDRMDMREVVNHYTMRWASQQQFDALDARFRPLRRPSIRQILTPWRLRRRTAASQIALIARVKQDRRAVAPGHPVLYFPLMRPRREWVAVPPTRKMPVRVGVLQGRARDEELAALAQTKFMEGHRLLFRRLNVHRITNLNRVDILWVGYGADLPRYHGLTRYNEEQVLKYASRGGIVVALAPNTRPLRANKLGWVPDPLVFGKNPVKPGVHLTPEGRPVFQQPHEVDTRALRPLVWWDDWSDRYVLLASATTQTRNEEHPVAVGLMLPYGQGLYIVLGIGPETPADLAWSVPLARNLLQRAIRWKESQLQEGRRRFVA
jgi:hypothetical protein